MQSLVFGLEHLVLVLIEFYLVLVLVLILVLKKSLDYITASGTSNVISAYLNIGLSFNLEKEYESPFIAAYSVGHLCIYRIRQTLSLHL